MIAWMMLAQAALLGLLGAGVTVAGIAKVRMNDWILGAAAIATLTLVVQIVASIIAPFTGSGPTGDPFEYWVYLVMAVLIPPAVALWALIDKGRWGVVALGVALMSVGVMVYRMHQIWFVQVF
ncbi:hypothetical protein [Agrococcus casei]|uniref:Putative integral membrane protein n=2 Tax=Agrococcus TaxID=46352 RepID=A0A1R4FW06_9MICO|nr:putative integral membrane protein [Agrococcus casei LMG 22410]